MKTTSPSFLSQAARLLFIICATLVSALFSLGSAAAQSMSAGSIDYGSSDTFGASTVAFNGGGDTLPLTVNNSYTGGTVLNSGSLTVENYGALGTAPVTLNGGNLILTTGASLTQNPSSIITITKPETSKLQVNQLTLADPTSTYVFDVTSLDNNAHELISYVNSPGIDENNFSISGQNSDSYLFTTDSKNGYQQLKYSISTDAHFIVKDTPTITDSFTANNLSFDANSTLEVDGTLTVKNISSYAPNATMILDPNATVDLGGSTLTASSLTLADGTEAIDGTISSFKLSNGATIINGTVIIDSTQPDAIHLVESNEHSGNLKNNQGTATLIMTMPDSNNGWPTETLSGVECAQAPLNQTDCSLNIATPTKSEAIIFIPIQH